MESRYIYHKDGISWCLFAATHVGFSEYDSWSPVHIASVLAEVRRVFVDTFEKDTVNSHPLLSVLYSNEGPVCFRNQNLIFLSSQGSDYNRHIYQFAHELCHFMVPGDTVVEYRWFNETLCQAMSWYAMQRIYQTRKDHPCEALESAYEEMGDYIRSDMRNRANLHGSSVSWFIQQNWEYLRQHWTDYSKNRSIAYSIYVLLCKHPEMWKIVPFLDQLTPDMSLKDAIKHLFDLARIPGSSCDLLTQRLCEQSPVAPQ